MGWIHPGRTARFWAMPPAACSTLGFTVGSGRDLLREAIDYAVVLAAERGLVCYDPQYGTLR